MPQNMTRYMSMMPASVMQMSVFCLTYGKIFFI